MLTQLGDDVGSPEDEDLWLTDEDGLAWAKGEHESSPAQFAICPTCNRFSRHPRQRTYGTQNGTDHVTGGYCAQHGAWSEGSL